ncbi:MAG: FecR family protein [Candidatus Cyclobacteriaceae bacterium M3_2C_046]
MSSDYKKILLYKYFHNQCTEDELRQVNHWLSASEPDSDLENFLNEHWNEISNFEAQDSELAYDKVYKNIHGHIKSKIVAKGKSFSLIRYGIAASFLVLIISGLWLYFQSADKDLHDIKGAQVIHNPKGEKSKITLSDGTTVWINSASTISYGEEFNKGTRLVYLTGEAYFNVEPNKDIPFVICTSDIQIKVLGTSFNVSAYPEENITTTLVEGKVEMRPSGKNEANPAITLKPHQLAVYSRQESLFKLQDQVDVELYTSWKDGKLIFRNEKFKYVAKKLERWYGIEIDILDQKLPEERFTGTIQDETLEEFMQIMNLSSTPIDWKISDSKVYMKLK